MNVDYIQKNFFMTRAIEVIKKCNKTTHTINTNPADFKFASVSYLIVKTQDSRLIIFYLVSSSRTLKYNSNIYLKLLGLQICDNCHETATEKPFCDLGIDIVTTVNLLHFID